MGDNMEKNDEILAKKDDWRYFARGRYAESLAEFLFKSSGWEMWKFGQENQFEYLTNIAKDKKNWEFLRKKLSAMPDYVIRDDKTDEMHFVEVKWCTRINNPSNDLINALNRQKDMYRYVIFVLFSSSEPYILFYRSPYKQDFQIPEGKSEKDFDKELENPHHNFEISGNLDLLIRSKNIIKCDDQFIFEKLKVNKQAYDQIVKILKEDCNGWKAD